MLMPFLPLLTLLHCSPDMSSGHVSQWLVGIFIFDLATCRGCAITCKSLSAIEDSQSYDESCMQFHKGQKVLTLPDMAL